MRISVIDLGKISFKEAFAKQIQAHAQILHGIASHTLILCEHPHTITLSRQARIEHILDRSLIKGRDIDFIMGVNRGGDITYHGSGQLVGYLVFDLRQLNRDLGRFLKKIEEALMNTLIEFGIQGNVIDGFRGVWVGQKKIASIGIGVEKWVTLHGFALNINTDLNFFTKIRPCGLNIRMTSMQDCLNRQIDLEPVKKMIVNQLQNSFEFKEVEDGKRTITEFRRRSREGNSFVLAH